MHQKSRRARRLTIAMLLVALCSSLAPASASGAGPKTYAPPEPDVIQVDGGSLEILWRAPVFSIGRVQGDDGLRSVVEAPGWPAAGVPGEPALPYATTVVVAPPTGGFRVDVRPLGSRTVRLSYPLKLEPEPTVPEGIREPRLESAASQHLGERDLDHGVSVEELGWLRGHRLVQVTFWPVQYDRQRSVLNVVDGVQVRVTFEEPVDGRVRPSNFETQAADPFTSLLEDTVVNPDQVEAFARQEEASASSAAPRLTEAAGSAAAETAPRYKIAVEEEGLYELTYEALTAAGVPIDAAAPEDLRLSYAREEVSYQWEGDGDGSFEAGERILFYARPAPTRWAAHDVYWLTIGEPGTPMDTRPDSSGGESGTLWATAQEEENRRYLTEFRSERDGDHWYWKLLYGAYSDRPPDEVQDEVQGFDDSVTLLGPDPDGGTAVLRLFLQGETTSASLDPDHRLTAHWNGYRLTDIEWNGQTFYTSTQAVPVSHLRAGANELRLTPTRADTAAGIDNMWLDAIEVRYPVADVLGEPARLEGEPGERHSYTITGLDGTTARIYDVSQPLTPTLVIETTPTDGSVTFSDEDDTAASTYYLLTEDQIRTPEWIAPARELPQPPSPPDYLIISHSDFITSVTPLADYRAANDGLTVHTVPVEAVYDAFGDGRVDPQAIKEYIEHAYEEWEWETSYLLLVGDGTHDPLNNLQSPDHQRTFIPPYLAMVDPFWGEVPSDNRYVTLGGPDDQLPELIVGRLPVNTTTELEAVVNKILAYDQPAPPAPLSQPLLFFADATDGVNNFHARSDNIHAHAQRIASAVHPRERIYYCDEELEDCAGDHLITDQEEMTDAVFERLNRGAFIVTWMGHAFWEQWGADRLFHMEDVPNLSSTGRLPIFLQMTCFTSYFTQPTRDTLDESLLRKEDGGAVATWGSSGSGLTAGHVSLHQGFVDAVLGPGPARVGPATVAARMTLNKTNRSLWDTYMLFGDPAMELTLWKSVHLPLVLRGGAN